MKNARKKKNESGADAPENLKTQESKFQKSLRACGAPLF